MLRQILHFLNLVEGRQLSLTHAFLLVLVVRAVLVPPSMADALLLVTATASYVHKRHLRHQKSEVASATNSEFQASISDIRSTLSEHQTKLSGLQLQAGLRK